MYDLFREFKHNYDNIWSIRKKLKDIDFIDNTFGN
jgi:hypothetical protein